MRAVRRFWVERISARSCFLCLSFFFLLEQSKGKADIENGREGNWVEGRTIYLPKTQEAIGRLDRAPYAGGRFVLVALLRRGYPLGLLLLLLLLLLVGRSVVAAAAAADLAAVVAGIVVVRRTAAGRVEGIASSWACLFAKPHGCLVSVAGQVVCWRRCLRIDPSCDDVVAVCLLLLWYACATHVRAMRDSDVGGGMQWE